MDRLIAASFHNSSLLLEANATLRSPASNGDMPFDLAQTQRVLRSIARQYRSDQLDAEDLVQDALLKIWRDHAQFDPSKGNWLQFISIRGRYAMIDQLRAQHSGHFVRDFTHRFATKRPRVSAQRIVRQQARSLGLRGRASSQWALPMYLQNNRISQLDDAAGWESLVKHLDAKAQLIVTLYHRDGLDSREIGLLFKRSPSWAVKQLHESYRVLREVLQ